MSELEIRAEPSLADPQACKFVVGRAVHAGGPFLFKDAEQAKGSPLPERLFQIPGVASVLVAGNIVTIGKSSDTPWRELGKAVGAALRGQLLSGVPALLEHPPGPRAGDRGDAELKRLAQELIDREINPGVAGHGGKISVVDVKQGSLYLAMSGGCQGCASSQLTLRQGVEVMVRRALPEVVDIIDTTDHSAGREPFYRRES